MRSFLLGAKTEVRDMPTARDYVQDGLIAMWDGIENAGWGRHDDTQTEWPDLITGFKKTVLQNYTWTERSFSSSSPGYSLANAHMPQYPAGANDVFALLNAGTSATYELCHKEHQYISGHDLRPQLINLLFEGVIGYYTPGKILLNCRGHFGFPNGTPCPLSGTVSTVSKSDGGHLYLDGVDSGVRTSTAFSPSPSPSRDYVLNDTTEELYCVRIYNRALTPAEIAANYAVDQRRFGL